MNAQGLTTDAPSPAPETEPDSPAPPHQGQASQAAVSIHKTEPRLSAAARAAERLAKLQEQIKAAKQQERAALNRQATIVGRAVIAAMTRAPEFRRLTVALLRKEITRPADLAEIAPLLIEP